MNKLILFTLIIILVILYIVNINYIHNYKIKSKIISIGVPCILKHSKHLPTLIKSINNQTLLPYEIIISLSSTDKKNGERIRKQLNEISKVNVKVIDTIEVRYPGDNRNICVNNCNTELISFIDADDELCPTRTEVLEKVYNKYNYDVLYHLHTDGKKCNNFDGKIWDNKISRNKIDVNRSQSNFADYSWFKYKGSTFHYGHSTIKVSLGKKHPQKNYRMGEDINIFYEYYKDKSVNIVALPNYNGTIYNKELSTLGPNNPHY